eukprot:3311140-Rhodomonas_salina.1
MTYAVAKLLFVLRQSEAGSCVLGALSGHKDLSEHAPGSLDNAIVQVCLQACTAPADRAVMTKVLALAAARQFAPAQFRYKKAE